jgi:uncharacterized protein (TIGR02466 family)
MSIYKEEWWPTPVWYYDIPTDEINLEKIAQECYFQKNVDPPGRTKSNRKGWQSQSFDLSNFNKNTEIIKLIKQIEKLASQVFNDFGILKKIPTELGNFWININHPSSFNVAHVHSNSVISGVCYIKSNDHAGNLFLHNRSDLEFINKTYTDCNNKSTFSDITYSPVQGRIIFFPGWINHSVGENKSTEDRISISFNF